LRPVPVHQSLEGQRALIFARGSDDRFFYLHRKAFFASKSHKSPPASQRQSRAFSHGLGGIREGRQGKDLKKGSNAPRAGGSKGSQLSGLRR
jgi:hypothetical protein